MKPPLAAITLLALPRMERTHRLKFILFLLSFQLYRNYPLYKRNKTTTTRNMSISRRNLSPIINWEQLAQNCALIQSDNQQGHHGHQGRHQNKNYDWSLPQHSSVSSKSRHLLIHASPQLEHGSRPCLRVDSTLQDAPDPCIIVQSRS